MASNRGPSNNGKFLQERVIFPTDAHSYSVPPSRLWQADLHPNPTVQFLDWLSTARAASLSDNPEYCTLSTAELPSGRVSSRIVQLKGLEHDGGFIFFVNLESSRKADDLATNSHASLVFYWGLLQRQVRIEGKMIRYGAEEKLDFFAMTSRQSRIASWVRQSSAVSGVDRVDDDGRKQVEEWLIATEKRFPASDEVPIAPSWGVVRLIPARIEFWQAGPGRLHDRVVYEWHKGGKGVQGAWNLTRLWP